MKSKSVFKSGVIVIEKIINQTIVNKNPNPTNTHTDLNTLFY